VRVRYVNRRRAVLNSVVMATGTSYERTRTNAYSEDLRWRIIYQRLALDYSLQHVADNLGVAVATVHRIETAFAESGSVGKKKYPEDHGPHKLTETDELFILGLVLERPETYLHEIQIELQTITGTEVNLSTICRCIHRNGFTHKKLKTVALQRNEMLREQYTDQISIFKKEMFVFVDETGTDRWDALRKFGYSLEVNEPHSKSFLYEDGGCQLLEYYLPREC